MSNKCHQNENYEYISGKSVTYAPGNAFDSRLGYLLSTLSPHAKPFLTPLDVKNMSDYLTFNFMNLCMILSLAINLNWIKRVTSLSDRLNELRENNSSFLPDMSASLEYWNESNVIDISEIPAVVEISTPNITEHDETGPETDQLTLSPTNLTPLADPFIPLLSELSFSDRISTTSTISSGNVSLSDANDPKSLLTGLKEKNAERPIIAHLNINSISSKFEPLVSLIKETIDLLLVTESKLDDTFPADQFQIEGFLRPIRLDRNRNGGGLIIFAREGLTCRELKPRKLYPDLECTFLELRIRDCKWLVVMGYNPHKEKIGNFLDLLSREIDQYLPNYDNLLMLGDWNSTVTETEMVEFCEMYNLNNLIKEPTCFKSMENPSSIDIMSIDRVFKIPRPLKLGYLISTK